MIRAYSKSLPWHIIILPGLYLIDYFYLIQANGPFYLTRVDPEYVYLLNGLNSAVFHFDRIGHIDHPGTPFQLFLGICIRAIHLIFGKGNILNDVLQDPELYLKGCSHILAILFSILILWAGKIGNKKGWIAGLILQSTPFLTTYIPDLSLRIMPDRFGFMLSFLILLLIVRNYVAEKGFARRSAVVIGLLSGLLCAVKIIFLPIIIIALSAIVHKRIYVIGSVIFGFFLGILPVLNRLDVFNRFIGKVITHDGIYGAGNEQIINSDLFLQHVVYLIKLNPSLFTAFILAIVTLILIFKERKSRPEFSLILGFLFATIIATIMVAKHYKEYYIINATITTGPMLFILYLVWKNHMTEQLFPLICLAFTFLVLSAHPGLGNRMRQTVELRESDAKLLEEERASANYLLIKPEWSWGLSREYGLIYGFSYVRHRDRYADKVENLFEEVISFEGDDRDPMIMRSAKFEMDKLKNTSILVVDQPSRPSSDLTDYLMSNFQIEKIDSIPTQSVNVLLKVYLGEKKNED